MKVLETKRMILREWKDEDIVSFAAMNQDPKVMEFFPSILNYEESVNIVSRARLQFKEEGFCLFAVEIKASGEFIGFVGLSVPRFNAHFTPCVEIGWRIASQYWGQGYATEAAKEVLHAAFKKYNLKEVVSFTSLLNRRSIRIMEKIGLQHDPKDDFDHPSLPIDHPLRRHVLFRLNKEWFDVEKILKEHESQ